MSAKDDMKDYLAQHPRMIGGLFAMVLLVSQAGSAAAVMGSATQVGP